MNQSRRGATSCCLQDRKRQQTSKRTVFRSTVRDNHPKHLPPNLAMAPNPRRSGNRKRVRIRPFWVEGPGCKRRTGGPMVCVAISTTTIHGSTPFLKWGNGWEWGQERIQSCFFSDTKIVPSRHVRTSMSTIALSHQDEWNRPTTQRTTVVIAAPDEGSPDRRDRPDTRRGRR